MEFNYSPDGLDAGLCFTRDGVRVRLTSLAHTKSLTAVDCEIYARALLTFHEGIGRVRPSNREGISTDPNKLEGFGIIDHPRDLIQPGSAQFVKYTTKDAFHKYYARGQFQLGSIVAYRDTSVASALDPQEGYCNVVFRSRGEHHFATVRAGNNLRLFCGAATADDQHLKNRFGAVQLRLRDIAGFGDAVAAQLGARAWSHGRVTYARQKVFRVPGDCGFGVAIEDLVADPSVMSAFHEYVVRQCAPSTVFLKPNSHVLENESRFVFEMPEDVKGSFDYLSDSSLLDFFEILDA